MIEDPSNLSSLIIVERKSKAKAAKKERINQNATQGFLRPARKKRSVCSLRDVASRSYFFERKIFSLLGALAIFHHVVKGKTSFRKWQINRETVRLSKRESIDQGAHFKTIIQPNKLTYLWYFLSSELEPYTQIGGEREEIRSQLVIRPTFQLISPGSTELTWFLRLVLREIDSARPLSGLAGRLFFAGTFGFYIHGA